MSCREEMAVTRIDIPVLEIHHKIYYRAGYKHATVKMKTIDCTKIGMSSSTVHSKHFRVTPENMVIFEKMKLLSEKLIPIREELFKLSRQLDGASSLDGD